MLDIHLFGFGYFHVHDTIFFHLISLSLVWHVFCHMYWFYFIMYIIII
jgi:hypothetical protein